MPLSLLIVGLQPAAAAATNGSWYPCTFNREFVQWTGAAAQCTPGAPVPCVTSSDCAALPGACCPHYGPGQGSCGFLGCLRADGTNTSAFCGTTVSSPGGGGPNGSVPAGRCVNGSRAPICALCVAGACNPGNAMCLSAEQCADPSPMMSLQCFPKGHKALHPDAATAAGRTPQQVERSAAAPPPPCNCSSGASFLHGRTLGARRSYRRVHASSAEECCQACRSNTEGCAAFNFEPSEHEHEHEHAAGQGTCYLQADALPCHGRPCNKPNAISGALRAAPPPRPSPSPRPGGGASGPALVTVGGIFHHIDPLFKCWNIDPSENRGGRPFPPEPPGLLTDTRLLIDWDTCLLL
jgi:hypothetical protein